jgi:adenosine deaminase
VTTKILTPKAEIHCHLEGSIPPALARELAERNGIALPSNLFDGNGHYAWKDFLSFLDSYDRVCTALKTPRDFSDVIYSYLATAAREGATYVEMFCSPERPAKLGISYADWLAALASGIDRAGREFGVVGRIIIICIRHLGPERALAMAKVMVAEPHPYVVGFGMGGDEARFAPIDFAPAYRLVHEKGYGCTAHAGEVVGPESVWAAIRDLPVTRIGHGVRSAEDPALMAELARRGIVLEVCPGSNVALGLYADRAAHPLHRLIDAGVPVTLNSDDPPFFHTSLGLEYEMAGLGEQELRVIARRTIEASFVDADTKRKLLKEMVA